MGVKDDGSDSIAVQVTVCACLPRDKPHLPQGRARVSLARAGCPCVRRERKQESGFIHQRDDEQV